MRYVKLNVGLLVFADEAEAAGIERAEKLGAGVAWAIGSGFGSK